jgi:hypothetical protein
MNKFLYIYILLLAQLPNSPLNFSLHLISFILDLIIIIYKKSLEIALVAIYFLLLKRERFLFISF